MSKLGLSGFPVAAARARGEAAGALLCSALSALICRSALLVRIAGRKRPGGPFEHQLCLVPAMLLSSVCLSLSLSLSGVSVSVGVGGCAFCRRKESVRRSAARAAGVLASHVLRCARAFGLLPWPEERSAPLAPKIDS